MNLLSSKHVLQSLVAVIVMFGAMLFGTVQANAQGLAQDEMNWKTVPEAMQILDAEINQLALDLTGLIPGTTEYADASNHLSYYKLIYGALEEGSTVSDAVLGSLGQLDIGIPDEDPQGPPIYNQLLNDAVTLLTN